MKKGADSGLKIIHKIYVVNKKVVEYTKYLLFSGKIRNRESSEYRETTVNNVQNELLN